MECQFCCAWPLPTGIREKTLRLRRQQGSALFKARGAGVCGRYRPRAGRTRDFSSSPRPGQASPAKRPPFFANSQFVRSSLAGLGHVKRRHIGRSSRKYYFILSLNGGGGGDRARPLAGPAAGKLSLARRDFGAHPGAKILAPPPPPF